MTVYRRVDGQRNRNITNEEVVQASAFDCNPAVEAHYTTQEESNRVRSRKWRSDYALGDTQAEIQARM